MRNLSKRWLITSLLAIALGQFLNAESVNGQNRRDGRQRGGGKSLPGVGKELPDVSVLDEEGVPFKLRSITGEGKYAVVVFGCLT